MEVSEKIEELEKNLKKLSDKVSEKDKIIIEHEIAVMKNSGERDKYRRELKRVCITIEILKRGVKEELIGPEVPGWTGDALKKHKKFTSQSKNKDFEIAMKDTFDSLDDTAEDVFKTLADCVHEWEYGKRGHGFLEGDYFYKACKLCGKKQVT